MTALNREQQRIAKLALRKGYFQHQIAAHFGVNQGRISEFKNSPTFKDVAPIEELPSGFPIPQ